MQSGNEELQAENARLKTQIGELENDKPNTKSLNSYKQLAMGTLALLYPDQVVIWRKWANSDLQDQGKSDLKFTEIEQKLESLNAKGITIKRDAISSKINESISLLAPKESKTN